LRNSFLPALWFLAAFQLRNALTQFLQFFRRLCRTFFRRSLYQVFHHVQGRKGCRLHLAQTVLDRALHFLVGVECRLQVPHDELLADAVRSYDELTQQFQRQPGGLPLGVFHDDLGQGHAGDVLTGGCVHHLQVCPISDQGGDVFQIDVAAAGSVVESAVCVFLDDHFVGFHRSTPFAATQISLLFPSQTVQRI